jgi:hypothetical protein
VAAAPRRSTGLVTLVIGLAAVLTGIIGFTAGRLTAPPAVTAAAAGASTSLPPTSAKPSSSPTVASSTKKGFSLDGTTLTGWTSTGSSFTTTMPSGWKIGNYNGGPNSGQIVNATGDTIDYHSGYERSAADNCSYLMLSAKTSAGETVTDLPGHTWAGKPVTAARITVHSNERNMMVVLTYFCLDSTSGHSDLLRTISTAATNASVMGAATSVLTAWTWG